MTVQREGVIHDAGDFTGLTEPFRRELVAHCYRMIGSVDDAEDMVQETYLRAWRSFGGFEGRSSVRTWLYQIATNACLTALGRNARRALPSGLGAPGHPDTPLAGAQSKDTWLQPIPDALVTPESGDPAAIAVAREGLRLAFVASLQYLPARQRAVLLLRDGLAFPAAEVAAMLGITTTAVKSALQRARTRLAREAPTREQVAEPASVQARSVLDLYITAFETANAEALRRLLHADVTLELPPSPLWTAGEDAAAGAVAGLGARGDWRMIPVAANGQPGAAAYLRDDDGTYQAYGIVELTVAGPAARTRIARITVFADPGLLARFALPPVHARVSPAAPGRG